MERLIDAADGGEDAIRAAEARLRATGKAYVRFALGEPGWFRTAFAATVGGDHYGPDEGVGGAGLGPLGLRSRQLDELLGAGGMDPAMRPDAEYAAWSAVHGFSMLLLEGPLRELPEGERDAALARTLETVQRGLRMAA